jgi:hypothetical protein
MKKILLFLFAMLASSGLFAQIVLMTENMDSYATSSFLAVDNPTWFTTWSNLPGSGEDAQILTNFAHSGTKSASADMTGGQTDCVLKLGDLTTNRYELKWWMYVETTKSAYYNIQHFQAVGTEWAFEIYFRTNGDIHLYAGGLTINGTYPKATWFEVKQIVKLDVDSIYLYINGSLLSKWPFHWTNSTTTGTNKLGAVDLFAGEESGSGETPGFYFDDVSFSQLGTLAPTVVTQAATGVTSNAATLNGTVNANIQNTTPRFEYGLTTAYGSTVAAAPILVTGQTATPVTAGLTGLLPGATYHYKVCGVNSVGTSCGLDMTFTTTPILPAVVTTAATSVSSTSATLNGTVDAGGASTTVTFEYGLTTAYGTSAAGVPATVTGNGPTPVNAAIGGLTVNTTYHYRVKGVNSVGPTYGLDMSFLTTSCPMPSPAGVITGPTNACGNSTGNVYSVAPITNATGYTWTTPTGSSITAGGNTNSITVTMGTTSGTVTVKGTNTCGDGGTSTLPVTVNPAPVPTITGQSGMCANSGFYTYTTQTGMNNYAWTVTSGGSINGGQGTSSVLVAWNSAGPQVVSVNYTNATGCPAGTPSTFPVTVTGLPGAAGTVTGSSTVCAGITGIAYSVPIIPSAVTYVWTLPAGASIASGSGTRSITVNFGTTAVSGDITVFGNNLCGSGTTSPSFPVTVNPLAAAAGTVTGPASVCQGQTGVIYSVDPVANATGYNWSLPPGCNIISGGNTNSITVDFTSWALAGNVTVYGTNSCGNGTVSPAYAINPLPVPPMPFIYLSGSTLMSNAAAGNQWYMDGTLIQAATGQSYEPQATGTYTDIVTVNGCSSPVSEGMYIVMTGIGPQVGDEAISLYPNPNDGQFTITISSLKPESFTVSVINNIGVKIMEVKDIAVNGNMDKKIDLRPIPGGFYSVVIRNSESIVVKKILVNR